MIRYFMFSLFLLLASYANATTTGADWWENCPGPACPAIRPSDQYEKAEKAEKAEKENASHERIDTEEIRKENDNREKLLNDNDNEKGERERDQYGQ